MTALRTVLAFNGPALPITSHTRRAAGTGKALTLARNMALFLASPFIGLAYALLLPFVGLGMLLWVATRGMRKSGPATGEVPVEEAAAPEARVEESPAAPQATTQEPARGGFAAAAKLALELLLAPLAGLAFVVLMPFAALAALVWAAMKPALQPTS